MKDQTCIHREAKESFIARIYQIQFDKYVAIFTNDHFVILLVKVIGSQMTYKRAITEHAVTSMMEEYHLTVSLASIEL